MKPRQEEDKKSQGNIYDRILKENAEALFIPLIQKFLGIQIDRFNPD